MHKTQLHDHYAHVHITTQGWSLEDLLRRSPNFREVPRVPQYSHRLADTIKEHEAAGTPLIIEKWEKHQNWEKASFTVEHFAENTDNIITVRNVHDWTDKSIPLTEFIHKSRNTVPFASSNESERLYGKDATCPNRWRKWLKGNTTLPPSLSPEGPEDLLRCRPKDESIETLMCYLGIGDTFTPCHKDLCASSGHNLMVYTEKDGSSYWFMTQSASAPVAEGYFNSLREVLDHETHVITVEQLAKAPFNIYIAEQKLGDLVLVPPRSCHQVVNAGGITIKASWSRMTFKGLETALYHELPLYRRVCRPETYRVKETTYHALIKLTEELGQALTNRHLQERESTTSTDTADAPLEGPNLDEKGFRKLLENIRCLIDLYRSILMEDFPNDPESLSSGATCDKQYCDFCGADIFQTYFICQANCHSPAGDCIICSGCYVEGRSCKCENMEPMQCRPFSELLYVHEQAVTAYNAAVNRGVCAEMKTIRTGYAIRAVEVIVNGVANRS
ncbi:hypothetical protein BDQ17DRAFT_1231000 [Cyathus striatus]|nr:hypothetical protein BDQ17DRAFT_1231000 [Cyathus striatus]